MWLAAWRDAWLRPSDRQVVEHRVDDHARHGYVQPDGQRDPRNGAVPREPALEREEEYRERERDDGQGEQHVAGEHREVHRAYHARSAEPRVAVHVVIDQVAHEKEQR